MNGQRSLIERLSTKLYGWLLSAYPKAHRRSYGKQMLDSFRDLCRETYRQQGATGLLVVWLKVLADTGSNALREHIAERRTYMGRLKALLTRKLISESQTRECAKWVFAAMVLAIPIVVGISLETGEFQMDPPQYFVYVMAAIALCLSMILLGMAADRAPKVKGKFGDRLADRKERKMVLLELLCSFVTLALFFGSFELLAQVHPDRVQLLIGTLSIGTCACLLTAIWLFLISRIVQLRPAGEPAGHSA
jgi:hypothetical protein